MMTVVSRSGMESEKPSRTVLAPKALWTLWNWIMRGGRGGQDARDGHAHNGTGGPCRGFARPARPGRHDRLSQKHQRPERVQHQDRLAAQDDRAGRVAADTLCPAAGGKAHDATGKGDGDAEARRFHQTEPDVLPLIEEPEALDEFESGEVEQIDCGQPARGD